MVVRQYDETRSSTQEQARRLLNSASPRTSRPISVCAHGQRPQFAVARVLIEGPPVPPIPQSRCLTTCTNVRDDGGGPASRRVPRVPADETARTAARWLYWNRSLSVVDSGTATARPRNAAFAWWCEARAPTGETCSESLRK